jgi:hypothetical protein
MQTFAGETAADINRLLVDLNGQKMVAQKLKAFDASAVNPGEYTGDFFSHELGTVYTFVNSGKQLMVKHARMDDFILTSQNKNAG